MKISIIISLTGIVTILSIGQILFKKASEFFPKKITVLNVFQFLFNPYFFTACFFYASATVLWVYVLRTIPLNKAYPFVALSFIFVPILAYFLFRETISITYMIGMVLIVLGISLTGIAS